MSNISTKQDPSNSDMDIDHSQFRYAAYANRLRTIAMATHRYLAYTSDFAESFRPVVPSWAVKGGYLVSWAYVLGDVSYEATQRYKIQQDWLHRKKLGELSKDETNNPPVDWRALTLRRAIFQSIASMALPAFTIHSIVKLGIKGFSKSSNPAVRNWGPVALGLAGIPALPYMFDEPVEHIIDSSFDYLVKEYRKKNPVYE